MMILAVDTATMSMSVALSNKGVLLGEVTLQTGLTHSETLMPSIDDLFRQCGCKKDQLTAIGCSSGPGSYTGIRIGVSTSLGIAYANQIPAYGFSTLEILAESHQYDGSNLICPAIDARNNRVYAGAYYLGKQVIASDNYAATDFRQLIEKAARTCEVNQALILGSGSKVFCQENLSGSCELNILPAYEDLPRGAVIATMTEHAYLRSPDINPAVAWEQLKPCYISLTQAERNRMKQTKPESEATT